MATLYDLARQYLAQPLPDISGIFQPVTDTPVEETPVEETVPGITPQLLQSTGGGDGYSVYNPDPNMTRTSRNYVNPFPYDPMDDFGTSDYGYPGSPKTGIMGLYDKYQNLPTGSKIGLGAMSALSGGAILPLAGGVVGIGKLLSGMLPPSKAGIFQNELLGSGFMLDNTGRIVSNNYNTPQGIMAGYNPVSGGGLYTLSGGQKGEPPTYGLDKSFDKRRETVAKALEKMGMSKEDIEAAIAGEYEGDAPINPITGMPTKLVDRLRLFNESQNLLNKKLSAAEIIYNRKVKERLEKNKDKTDEIKKDQYKIDAFKKMTTNNAGGGKDLGGIKTTSGSKTPDYSNVTTAKGPPSEIGGGSKPNPGSSNPKKSGGSKSSKSSSKNSSQKGGGFNSLGFSDIRLKENVELIGKSPSNINIYKFNYKNNPTTYQGAMAHEVPWASVKHSNGYMMVDYNLIDIEFKKYNA
jgi:hypothetical protein